MAASGGRDSTALLHATVHVAQVFGLRVVALHVHHGLNPAADDWLKHLQATCQRWSKAGLPVSLRHRHLGGSPSAGTSVEAWARRERYMALADMAREEGAGMVLVAHHRRDQAETVLLQALRGGGPKGLAAMPREVERDGILWCRPWLDLPSESIAHYVRRYRLRHIEDDSNANPRFDRNRVRLDVWPALTAAFPNAEASFCDVARLMHEAADLATEVGRADVDVLRAGTAPQPGLLLERWVSLSTARRAAALRTWLNESLTQGVRESLVQRLMLELPRAQVAKWPLDDGRMLRLYRGLLTIDVIDKPNADDELRSCFDRAGSYSAPRWQGCLELTPVSSGGVPAALLAQAFLRDRQPGDQFQFKPASTLRSLKKQFQAAGIPAWHREAPVLATNDAVLFVPGLGTDARALAAPGEPRLSIQWLPALGAPSASVG